MEEKQLAIPSHDDALPVTYRPMPVTHYGEGTSLEAAQGHDTVPMAYMLEAASQAWIEIDSKSTLFSTCNLRLLKERRDLMGLPSAYTNKEIKGTFTIPLD